MLTKPVEFHVFHDNDFPDFVDIGLSNGLTFPEEMRTLGPRGGCFLRARARSGRFPNPT